MTTSPTRVPAVGSLTGKVAIVTGAAKGLGAAITRSLAAQGAQLAMCGRDLDALERHAKEIGDADTLAIGCSVLDEESVQSLVAQTVDRFGGVDILVNTAGGIGPIATPVQEYPLEGFTQVLDLNVLGTFLPCKAVVPEMVKRGGGRIVNIAGTSGLHGYAGRIGYSSSKWAVRVLTRTLALELGRYNITANTICPNVTHGARMDTIIRGKAERLSKSIEEVYDDFTAETALGRFIDDVDIAAAVDYLVNESGRNVTGQDLVVDAGFRV
jgi:NAD(P)-dependent dehydrogenase (short-subunit alcohol dehydrogenase family)